MVELDKTDMDEFAAFHAESKSISSENVAARFRRQDKVLVGLLLALVLVSGAAALVLAIPVAGLLLNWMGLSIDFITRLNTWWFSGWQGPITAVVLGIIALLIALVGRARVLRNASLYVEAGCPQCQEHDLYRVSRYRRDRVLAALGFPIRRYVCRDCTWHGTRLAGLNSDLALLFAQSREEEVAVS